VHTTLTHWAESPPGGVEWNDMGFHHTALYHALVKTYEWLILGFSI
jgi:hypothetical protein